MAQGLFQTLLVRLPLAYYMSIQPDASLMKIGLAAADFHIGWCGAKYLLLYLSESR